MMQIHEQRLNMFAETLLDFLGYYFSRLEKLHLQRKSELSGELKLNPIH